MTINLSQITMLQNRHNGEGWKGQTGLINGRSQFSINQKVTEKRIYQHCEFFMVSLRDQRLMNNCESIFLHEILGKNL